MPIPAAQEIRKPILEAFKGEAPARKFLLNEFLERMAEYFGISLNELSTGDKASFKESIKDALMYLKRNELLYNPSGNTFMLTKTGTEVLEDNPDKITSEYLAARKNESVSATEIDEAVDADDVAEIDDAVEADSVAEIDEAVEADNVAEIDEAVEADDVAEIENDTEAFDVESENDAENIYSEAQETDLAGGQAMQENLDTEEELSEPMPDTLFDEQEALTEPDREEQNSDDSFLEGIEIPKLGIEDVIARHNSELADELLLKAAGLSSESFEMLVIDLLSKMGYFAFQTARYTTEASGSNLIHGVILDNKTGANIYIQARKLSPGRNVGRADIQDFIDELSDKGGKGIFATTASFSDNAKILANDERIMLIDGEKLASLMITHNFCVNTEKVYEVKAIDSEAFKGYEE